MILQRKYDALLKYRFWESTSILCRLNTNSLNRERRVTKNIDCSALLITQKISLPIILVLILYKTAQKIKRSEVKVKAKKAAAL